MWMGLFMKLVLAIVLERFTPSFFGERKVFYWNMCTFFMGGSNKINFGLLYLISSQKSISFIV